MPKSFGANNCLKIVSECWLHAATQIQKAFAAYYYYWTVSECETIFKFFFYFTLAMPGIFGIVFVSP